uniref:M-phase specific PLK1 interacting protein n=1 Tax=Leptobrachium leishanense TaxID=445787 RepID=A0A8C5MN16_9ANUR
MYRPNYRSPSSPLHGGGGSPSPFRSPQPYFSNPGGMLPPPLPNWGHGSPHTPPYVQRHSRPYGSGGGGGQSPGSSSGGGQGFHGGRFGGQSPGDDPNRGPSPRFHSSPYSKSPGGAANINQQQHHGRGYSSPRQPRPNYQGSPRTSTPFGTAHGRGQSVSYDVEKYYRPSMLEDPWANLKPISLSDINQTISTEQTTYTEKNYSVLLEVLTIFGIHSEQKVLKRKMKAWEKILFYAIYLALPINGRSDHI